MQSVNENYWKFQGGGGPQKPKYLKASLKKTRILQGWGWEMDIFWNSNVHHSFSLIYSELSLGML